MSAPAPVSNSADMTSSYPDLASPTDSVIAGDFGSLSAAEQERQRDEWKAELAKTEEEIYTLRQVLASKEIHAAGLKRRLGITAWREFSEDMQQGLKSLQDTQAFKKTAEGITAVKSKTASAWSSISSSTSFMNMSEKVGSAFGAAKNRVSASLSSHNISQQAKDGTVENGASKTNGNTDKIPEEK